MILLSETSTHKYYCIEVPLDAYSIFIGGAYDSKKLRFLTNESGKLNSVSVQIEFEEIYMPKILGVIGPEDSIPEEVIREIFPTMAQFRRKIKELGILIENPIEKSEPPEYDFNEPIYKIEERYAELLEEWQSHESKLKKVVIIKTEK